MSTDDKTRYAAQIVAAFEAPNYSDGDPAQGLHIVELMQEVRLLLRPSAHLRESDLPHSFSSICL